MVFEVTQYLLLSMSPRCRVLSRPCSWLWLSWRWGTLASPCSTARRPSWHRREPSSTPPSSTSSIFQMTRSLPSTSPYSCPCVSPSCCPCSRSPLRSDRGARTNRRRKTETHAYTGMDTQTAYGLSSQTTVTPVS